MLIGCWYLKGDWLLDWIVFATMDSTLMSFTRAYENIMFNISSL